MAREGHELLTERIVRISFWQRICADEVQCFGEIHCASVNRWESGKFYMKNKTYDRVCDPNNLMKAAKESMKGVYWKYSTQAYYLNRIQRVYQTKKRLESGDRMSDGFIIFRINERGRTRIIKSVRINERVVQRCLHDEVMMPALKKKLIYDNYSSIKGRGISMALKRVRRGLQRYYRKHGNNDGWVMVTDLHAYFDSVLHDPVAKVFEKEFGEDENTYALIMDFIDAFGDVGLGLGSEVSQITAVYMPNKIDHRIKEFYHIEGYGRFNDDAYYISESKEKLVEILEDIRKRYKELGIEMNTKKTKIVKMSSEFKFLKAKIHLTESGKVVMRPDHKNIVRERRKLKKLKQKIERGMISYKEAYGAYQSWKGYIKQFNSYRTIRRMEKLFDELFINYKWEENDNGKRYKDREIFYEFPDRQAPAERRHGIRAGAQRQHVRVRGEDR